MFGRLFLDENKLNLFQIFCTNFVLMSTFHWYQVYRELLFAVLKKIFFES